VEAPQSNSSKVGWRATAGAVDEKDLILKLQTALLDEISELKGQRAGKKTEVYDGKRIFSSNSLNVYRFLSDDADEWYRRKPQTELTVNINGEDFFGRLDSADRYGINIALETDVGDNIEEAVFQEIQQKTLIQH
jgi:hypothetical protein